MELTQGSEAHTPTVGGADPLQSLSRGSLGEWLGGIPYQNSITNETHCVSRFPG